jgi:hypothetical protein
MASHRELLLPFTSPDVLAVIDGVLGKKSQEKRFKLFSFLF